MYYEKIIKYKDTLHKSCIIPTNSLNKQIQHVSLHIVLIGINFNTRGTRAQARIKCVGNVGREIGRLKGGIQIYVYIN